MQPGQPGDPAERHQASTTFRVQTVHGSVYTVTASLVQIDGLKTVFLHHDACRHATLVLTTAHVVSAQRLTSTPDGERWTPIGAQDPWPRPERALT